MNKTRLCYKIFFIIIFISGLSIPSLSQIKIYERPSDTALKNAGLFFESSKRTKIDLNGVWQGSFDEGASVNKLMVPHAYDYKGQAIFRKNFKLDQSLIDNYSFILVAEGITYEANITINGIFIANHIGGSSSIVIPIDNKDVMRTENSIDITISSELSDQTIPLANLINYSRNYGGINKDIYLLAVPRTYIHSTGIVSTFEGQYRAKLKNTINIRSFDIGGAKNYSVQTILTNASTGAVVMESPPKLLAIDNFRSETIDIEFTIDNPLLWSPLFPGLYNVRTVITDSSGVMDEFNVEYGIRDVKFRRSGIILNGQEMLLTSISYNEFSPKFASALEYTEVERDLKLIKETGFNAIRVPGRTAHPYIVNLCNRLGLFLFQEVPFNDVPADMIADEEYMTKAYQFIEEMILRDRNAPCVIAWGLGNDFDVTVNGSAEYVKKARETAEKLDTRQVYYTTYNYANDLCSPHVQVKGINFFGKEFTEIKKIVGILKENTKTSKSSDQSLFVSSFGMCINNEDRNGYSDNNSVEAQSKYITDVYAELNGRFPVITLSSFADFEAERPLNYRRNANHYLNTSGIFNIYREPKLSAQFVKRVLYKQEQPKLLEGNNPGDKSYLFIVVGIAGIILFIFLASNIKRLKEGIWRSIYRPTNFFQFASEQMIIPVMLNVVLSIIISLGISLFVSGILYYYKKNVFLDMVLSNIFGSDNMKIVFSSIATDPVNAIVTFAVGNFILQFLITFVIYLISVFSRGRVFFKNLYTVSVWASVPMLIFLFIGTIIYKLGQESGEYIYLALILFVLMHLVYVVRLVKGVNVVFDISSFKTYMYAGLMIILIYGSAFVYFYFFTMTLSSVSLVKSYLAN